MGRVFRCGALLTGWLGLLSVGVAAAQVRAAEVQGVGPETDLQTAVSRLAARAAVVFVGTVETVEHQAGVVEVGLRVEQTLEGAPGSQYVLREWAGRWPPGVERYKTGQRALFFLQAPSAAGLSSPVDGGDGVVPVLGDPANGAVLDLRRLATRLERQVGDPVSAVQTMPLAQAARTIAAGVDTQRRPANPSTGVQPLPILQRGAAGAHAAGVADGAR